MLNIIYRVCDNVVAFSSNNRPRDFGTKKEVIKKCFKSLNDSLKYYGEKCNLIVVADHISKEIEEYIKSFNIIDDYIELSESGNGVSFVTCLEEGLKYKGLIFFLEDDYLLEENCIFEMMKFHEICMNNRKFIQKHICMYPCDYPDRYKNHQLCNVLLGHSVHWRTIKHTTCTFLIDDVILKEQLDNLKRFQHYGKIPGITEDNTINLMYEKYFCFSPIPSLGEHLQYLDTLSPFSKQRGKK